MILLISWNYSIRDWNYQDSLSDDE
jgi:hypothetical protein